MDNNELRQILYQAATYHQSGRLQEAELLYRRVLETAVANPQANHNIAVLTMQTGKGMDVALPYFKAAWQSDPAHHQHWLSYLRALSQVGDLSMARQVYADGEKRGLKGPDPCRQPATTTAKPATAMPARNPKSEADLSRDYDRLRESVQVGDFSAAEARALEMCQRNPDHALGWKGLGLALGGKRRNREAIAALQRAAQLATGDAEVWSELGKLLYQNSQFGEAELALRRLLSIAENYPGALLARAQTLLKLYRAAESEAACREGLSHEPNSTDILMCLGEALLAQDRDDEARAAFQQVLDRDPHRDTAYRALGNLLYEGHHESELIELCRQMIRAVPDYFYAYRDLGMVLLRVGRVAEAADAFSQGLRFNKADLNMRATWLYCCNYLSTMSSSAIREEAVRYGEYATAAARPFSEWSFDSNPKRLRVGLVSGDLCEHPVGYFLENVLTNCDQSRIEWIAYPTVAVNDSVSERLQQHVDRWTVLAGMSIEDCARQIHADGVHVLLDLSGHSAHNILPAFAWRPAPVQASWLGYFATTGVAEMDYFIADPVSVPQSEHLHFTESVWNLPDTRLCFTPPDGAPEVSALPALSSGNVTFGCFQFLPKITDEVLTTWAKVLAACVDARLRIQSDGLEDEEIRQAFTDRAEQAGLMASRLDLFGRESRADYLARYAQVDILLDTFPFPGGTTTCEALWMGVPTITFCGDTLVSRQGASLLCAAGLDDWVADSMATYIQLAIDKASDLNALNTLRLALRDQIGDSPLFDGKQFAENLITALWAMWEAAARRDQSEHNLPVE